MARQQDVFTLLGHRMRMPLRRDDSSAVFERPAIAELIRRIDQALQTRRAA